MGRFRQRVPTDGGGGMKPYIRQHLINDGAITEQNVTRTPKQRHCAGCGRVVIAAITDTGFEIAVEPHPTTTAGELDVLMAGGETFALLDHGEMVWRSQHRINYASPDKERTHARHECGKAPPEINPTFAVKARRIDFDGPPTF